MADIDVALAGTRAALVDFIAIAEACTGVWTRPRAPGKWSPSHVAEHVARALEESAKVADGLPSKLPNLPAPVRWFLRVVFLKRILRGGPFPRGRTAKSLDPADGSATPSLARARLEAALFEFDRACRSRSATGKAVDSPILGVVTPADFARFQELHVRHHAEQMRMSVSLETTGTK